MAQRSAFTLLDQCERKCTMDFIVARRWVGVEPGHHLGLLLKDGKGDGRRKRAEKGTGRNAM